MLASLRAARFPVEAGLLLALAFFLPLAEAPKNLLWLAYLATWLVNRVRARELGGRWDRWDSLIAAWIASGFVVAAFAGLHKSEWQGAGDLLRYGSLLWLVKRGGYSARELKWLLGMLVLSTVVGVAIGYFRLWTGLAKSGQLQLHSVGHVNHTAIYLAIVLGLCAAWLFARWRAWPVSRRTVALALTLLLLVSLMVTASRGAIGAGLIAVLLVAAGWWRAWRAPLVVSAVVTGMLAAAVLVTKPEVMQRHEWHVTEKRVLTYRDGIWRTAFSAWERHPWFGVGMDNYSRITLERVREWRAEAGKPFDPADYYPTSHGHSLFANTLAERGAIGSAALAAVLVAWLAGLLRRLPRREDTDFDRLAWGAAAGAWLVTIIAGTVNTTLHHEHGILAVLLLGTWLSQSRTRRAS